MNQGTLYIVSAPSGAGKTSLLNAVIDDLPGVQISISHTTRKPRPGEEHGKNYYFVDKEEFQQRVKSGDFLEHAEVFGNHYGTSREAVEKLLAQGKDVILEIDWQGARKVRQQMADTVSIFILPPSKQELESRLRNRKQDSDEIIQNRMKQARNEMLQYDEYDYVIINDNFDRAVEELGSVFRSRWLLLANQQKKNADLLKSLIEE
jgi:guanylate kinase